MLSFVSILGMKLHVKPFNITLVIILTYFYRGFIRIMNGPKVFSSTWDLSKKNDLILIKSLICFSKVLFWFGISLQIKSSSSYIPKL